jgi:type I restriction enzyme S subunit
MREDWIECCFEDLLDYEQPTKYIVNSTDYNDAYEMPVLTAGKSFIKGYTNEKEGIFENLPTIIFDDFTTASQYVDFKFKVKSSAMKILVPTSKLVNIKFAFYAMQVNQVRNDTHKRYWISVYAKKKFLLPPLVEQKAIISKIEELFSDLDKGIADLKTAQEQLIIYRHAVLKKAFEGGLTKEWREKNPYSLDIFLENLKFEKDKAIKEKLISKSDYFPVFESKDLTYQIPNQWLSLPWKTITSNNKYAMKRGPFGSALKKEFFVDKGIVVYEQGHAINDEPFRHRYFISEEKFEELKAFKTKAGDMIISCSGATLGRICLLPENADTGIINQALLKIDLDEKIILKKFFLMLFRSETFQRLIFEKSLGTAMPNMIGMAELKEIPIPIPSIEEQKIIIQEIESRLSVCDKIEQSITESLEKAKALRQSILKKAFEGKLLSKAEIERCKKEQDYEPAKVLLEKIKVEKKNKK